ncbi:glycosyltransferase [Arthrobacter sp. ZGTC212]|uniref:glycosyltransferase n=1 Tax=Arthrobacter sp. ZGTC212 TaxID=2058899 RepID=UPI0021589726|nr:glycosyltransferase [Arthrobacter sp. ZGTC212]
MSLSNFSSSKPRLYVFGHSAALSGAELNLLRSVAKFKEFDVTVIVGEDGPLVGALRNRGIKVFVVPLSRAAAQWRSSGARFSTNKILAPLSLAAHGLRLGIRLYRDKPDLLYTNSAKAHIYGGIAGRIMRRPVVAHLHDRISDDLMSKFNMLAINIAMKFLVSGIIANSKSTAQTLQTSVAVPVVVIPCALEEDIPVRVATEKEYVRFVVSGRISPWKGQHLAIEAFSRIRDRIPNGSTLDLMGGALFGEVDYQNDLEALISKHGLSDWVNVRGHVNNAPSKLRNYDVLLHTSTVPEPFGQVITEGLAAQVPVIAADAGGPSEILTHNFDGLLYPAGDVQALADAMLTASLSPGLRTRLAANGKRTASRYDVVEIVPEVEKFLASILARQSTHTHRAA